MMNIDVPRVTGGFFGICLLSFLLVPAAVPVTQTTASVDFSGKWVLNASKSDPGEGGAITGSEIVVITQNASSITFDRTFPRPGSEEIKRTETYSFDGKEETITPPGGPTERRKAEWSADKQALTITTVMAFTMSGKTTEYKLIDRYTLGSGGKTILVNSISINPKGERKTVMVYDKG